MKKFVVFCMFACAFAAVSAFAQQNKVVVVPMGSKSGALQHYRIAEQMGLNTEACITPTFNTPDTDTQAVITTNVSIISSVDDIEWWSNIEYSTDGAIWNNLNGQVTITGAVANLSSNTSETGLLNLAPNSSYSFRIDLASMSTNTSGQCELFITFNKTATSDVVAVSAPAPAAQASVPTGPGTISGE